MLSKSIVLLVCAVGVSGLYGAAASCQQSIALDASQIDEFKGKLSTLMVDVLDLAVKSPLVIKCIDYKNLSVNLGRASGYLDGVAFNPEINLFSIITPSLENVPEFIGPLTACHRNINGLIKFLTEHQKSIEAVTALKCGVESCVNKSFEL